MTGAGQRVGAAIAKHLGSIGFDVAVHFRSSGAGATATAEVVRGLGGRAETYAADLADRRQARALVARVMEDFGGIDLLVPSAASFEPIAFDAMTDDDVDRSLDLNVATPLALAHAARTTLAMRRGSIVFVTCTSPTVPYRGYLPYITSKGALRTAMRVLALELAPDVRVNAVAPGTVLPPPHYDAARTERLARAVPLERVGSAGDVAEAVAYLARAEFVTGHELVVDGGRVLSRIGD